MHAIPSAGRVAGQSPIDPPNPPVPVPPADPPAPEVTLLVPDVVCEPAPVVRPPEPPPSPGVVLSSPPQCIAASAITRSEAKTDLLMGFSSRTPLTRRAQGAMGLNKSQ
jgi:hypothetical protein